MLSSIFVLLCLLALLLTELVLYVTLRQIAEQVNLLTAAAVEWEKVSKVLADYRLSPLPSTPKVLVQKEWSVSTSEPVAKIDIKLDAYPSANQTPLKQ